MPQNSILPPKVIEQLPSPFQKFTNTQALSGFVLVLCAILALIWANSSYGHYYEELWHLHFSIGLADFHFDQPLHLWINDGLMAIFFFYVGLEIKEEILVGELSDFRSVLLPFLAALGGMILPGVIYYLMLAGQEGAAGWGIPMATDIAFSLGILMLLGARVPKALMVFLTAFAIVDDIGAVLIIAFFYTAQVSWSMLLISAAVFAAMLVLNGFNMRSTKVYIGLAIVLWYFVLQSGIHPTVAGILAALAIPANNRIRMREFTVETQDAARQFFAHRRQASKQFLSKKQINALTDIEDNIDQVQPPLQRLAHEFDPYVSFMIMPIFAFANAGVVFQNGGESLFSPVSWGILAGLIAGKVLGIYLFSWLGVKLGFTSLPANTRWIHVLGVGFLGGIGFTMALFIANLAFAGSPLILSSAKVGILISSVLAALIGYFILYFTLPKPNKKSTSGF